MNINIKMDKCVFYIDENKRTVVCIINNTRDLVLDFFNIRFRDWDPPKANVLFEPNDYLRQKLRLPKRFEGKAVCSPEDTWDVEAGKLIAFNRAKYKLNTSFFKRAQLYVDIINNEFDKLITSVNEYGARLERGAEAREEHIKKLAPNWNE